MPPLAPARARGGGWSLVRIDQELLAGGALGVGGEVLEVERLRQRDGPGVVAGEGRLQRAPYRLC